MKLDHLVHKMGFIQFHSDSTVFMTKLLRLSFFRCKSKYVYKKGDVPASRPRPNSSVGAERSGHARGGTIKSGQTSLLENIKVKVYLQRNINGINQVKIAWQPSWSPIKFMILVSRIINSIGDQLVCQSFLT